MPYKPDPTVEENNPNTYPDFDPASETSKPYPPAVAQAAERGATAPPKTSGASTSTHHTHRP